MTSKVSVLSPVYNEGKHIDAMIASVKNQTYRHWELIFVDDGSTDDTTEKIRSAAARDDRIKLLDTRGKVGKARAYNLAFSASTGDTIVLLAGDDLLPPDSLEIRSQVGRDTSRLRVGTYKLQTFSRDPKFDAQILPRGAIGSTSGGVMALNRPLAQTVFPIPEVLPSEDIWLGYAAPRLAQESVFTDAIVLLYRIHENNSNPRQLPFPAMSNKLAARHEAWRLLAESGLPFSPADRAELAALASAEAKRKQGDTLGVLRETDLPFATRLGLASSANRHLYRVRQHNYGLLSGWRRI